MKEDQSERLVVVGDVRRMCARPYTRVCITTHAHKKTIMFKTTSVCDHASQTLPHHAGHHTKKNRHDQRARLRRQRPRTPTDDPAPALAGAFVADQRIVFYGIFCVQRARTARLHPTAQCSNRSNRQFANVAARRRRPLRRLLESPCRCRVQAANTGCDTSS